MELVKNSGHVCYVFKSTNLSSKKKIRSIFGCLFSTTTTLTDLIAEAEISI